MSLVVHSPEAEMGGGSLLRVSNNDRTTRWVTFHFESEADADAAHKLLEEALKKAVKVEWPMTDCWGQWHGLQANASRTEVGAVQAVASGSFVNMWLPPSKF